MKFLLISACLLSSVLFQCSSFAHKNNPTLIPTANESKALPENSEKYAINSDTENDNLILGKLKKVVFIVLDGVRWQEFFGGGLAEYRGPNGQPLPRQEMMPFLWGKLQQSQRNLSLMTTIEPAAELQPNEKSKGEKNAWIWQSFGNRYEKKACSVSNPVSISLPGYADMLSGVRQKKVLDNKFMGILDQPTLFDLWFKAQVDPQLLWVLSSWSNIARVVSQQHDYPFPVSSGLQGNESQTPPWEHARFDSDTNAVLQEWLKTPQKKFDYLFVAFNDSDEYGHRDEYNSYLQAIKNQDAYIKGIVETVENNPEYKDKTLYVITTDHGRGETPQTWQNHKNTIAGSDAIWAVLGGPATILESGNYTKKLRENCNHIKLARLAANLSTVDYNVHQ